MTNTAKTLIVEDIEMVDDLLFGDNIISEDTLSTIDDEIMADFQKRLAGNEDEVDIYDLQDEIDEDFEDLTLETAVDDFKNGNQDAFDYIFMFYRPKLENVARKMNDEDLSQELAIVLYKAALSFNPNAGAKFNTYFWKCAQNHIGTQKIRQGAQKRGGSKHANNEELLELKTKEKNGGSLTTEEQTKLLKLEENAKPTKTVSLQATFDTKDNSVEMGAFVEDKTYKNQYKEANLRVDLDALTGQLKDKEIRAIDMIIDGYTLEEIGKELGNITAPAVHVMLRRLGKKKNIEGKLREMLSI